MVPLSTQQKAVLRWVVRGLTSKEIAERLRTSKRTVDWHRQKLTKKLRARSSFAAAWKDKSRR